MAHVSMTLFYFIMTLFYFSYLSSSFHVVLDSHVHVMIIYPCYVFLLGLCAHELVIHPCSHRLGIYASMLSRSRFRVYLLNVHTMYRLVDLCHDIGLVTIHLVAPIISTIARMVGVLCDQHKRGAWVVHHHRI